MKAKLILKTTGLLILVITLSILSSCTKSADEILTKEQKEHQDRYTESSSIDEKNFSESDEDITTVDYQEIYEQLTPYGEWLQVSPEEIGMNPGTALYEDRDIKGLSISDLIGVKDAHAAATANVEMVFVWKPSVDLGVAVTAGEAKVYKPYTNGQWINTDAGWYFKAPTPVEETVSHYGRWVNSLNAGWLWVPGRVWAPAWVDWRQNENLVSWAPLPPSVYIDNGILRVPVIADNNYMVVEKKYFLEPDVYRYNNIYYSDDSPILVSNMTRTEGVVVINNMIVNRGPDVNLFQILFGRNIETVKLQRVVNFNEVRYNDREYVIYTPVFKKFKIKGNKRIVFVEPKSYRKYNEWNVTRNEGKESGKEEIEYKGNKNNDKNRNNDFDKKNNGDNNGRNHDAGDNGNKNNGNDNRNDNSNKSNSKDKGNENNNKDGGNDKGNKHNGNDNNSKGKGNNNEKGKK